jgi:hypothetical protein
MDSARCAVNCKIDVVPVGVRVAIGEANHGVPSGGNPEQHALLRGALLNRLLRNGACVPCGTARAPHGACARRKDTGVVKRGPVDRPCRASLPAVADVCSEGLAARR